MSEAAAWLWIPIAFAAAAAQTVRNAVQRSVTKEAGVLPATFIRFFYGLPFAAAMLAFVAFVSPRLLPAASWPFIAWVTLGAVTQVLATAFFVAAMSHRSFVVAVVFSKTEVIQIGVYSVMFLGETVSLVAMTAIAVSTLGVVLLSTKPGTDHVFSWKTWSVPGFVPGRGVVLGLASGACFALASVGYRGAMLQLAHPDPFLSGAYGLVWAQSIQVLLLGAWLLARDRGGLLKVMLAWRVSLLAGLMGTLASMGWFTAYAMRSAVDVRIVALVEVLYSYAVSRRLFKEHVSARELIGMALVIAGIVAVSFIPASSPPP